MAAAPSTGGDVSSPTGLPTCWPLSVPPCALQHQLLGAPAGCCLGKPRPHRRPLLAEGRERRGRRALLSVSEGEKRPFSPERFPAVRRNCGRTHQLERGHRPSMATGGSLPTSTRSHGPDSQRWEQRARDPPRRQAGGRPRTSAPRHLHPDTWGPLPPGSLARFPAHTSKQDINCS